MQKKSKILIITNRLPPTMDANGVVVSNLAISLAKKGYSVYLLALTDSIHEQGLHKYANCANCANCGSCDSCVSCEKWAKGENCEENHEIYGSVVKECIYVPESKYLEHILLEFKQNKFNAVFLLTKKILDRVFSKLLPKYSKLSLKYKNVTSYTTAIENILLKNDVDTGTSSGTGNYNDYNFDACIVTMMPQDAVWVAFNVSSLADNIPIIVYQMDTYWNSNILPDRYREVRFNFEKSFTEKSLFVMTTPQIFRTNTEKEPTLSKKLIPVEFPLVGKQNNKHKQENKQKDLEYRQIETQCDKSHVNGVFSGSLYRDIRPPEKIVSIIAELNRKDIYFDFYGMQQHLVKNAKDFQRTTIILHGSVPTEEAVRAQLSASFLINIDNTNLTQVPSKIFEYISTGKPIVNFYFFDESPTLHYLSRYPLCLNINVNKLKPTEAAILLNDFIDKNVGKTIPFEEVEKLYIENTPDYVAEQFLKAYDERIEDFMKSREGKKQGV